MKLLPIVKAEELVTKFYKKQCSHSLPELAFKGAKESSLLCIDELEKVQFEMYGQDKEFTMYFLEVRKEIQAF